MRTKIVLFSLLCSFVYFIGCDDSLDQIGTGIQPDGDQIAVFDTVFKVTGRTIKLDSIYAKSGVGFLGKFYDPAYGELKADYACQFYYTNPFDSVYNNQIDSIRLQILYQSYIGDSLAPMEVSVYKLNKPLSKHYYTFTHPDQANNFISEYYNKNDLLGKQVYSARDLNISDSLNLANLGTQYKSVSVTLPLELAEDFYTEYSKPGHGALASPQTLSEFFPGVYVTSSFGNGNLLKVEKTGIYVYYTRDAVSPYTGVDTLRSAYASFEVAKDVIQLNSYRSDDTSLLSATDKMYIKTPAGVCPELTIPIQEIRDKAGKWNFSSVKLSINAYPKEDIYDKKWQYALDFPGTNALSSLSSSRSKLLLIEKDSVPAFFQEQKTADNQDYYFTVFNSSTSTYTFNNIANLVQKAINNEAVDELHLVLVPVQVAFSQSSSYYTTSELDYASSHYLYPSAVTLNNQDLQIEILAAAIKNK